MEEAAMRGFQKGKLADAKAITGCCTEHTAT